MAIAGDFSLRCRKCEGRLSRPKCVDQEKYAIVPTSFGAIVRSCKECGQLWLGYMQELPNGEHKIILKKIDKEL
jgi:uncharacterized Zn finger protein